MAEEGVLEDFDNPDALEDVAQRWRVDVTVTRRVGIAFGSFVIAWLAVSLMARLVFGSGNVLVWLLAALVGAGVCLELLRRDRRGG
ncbi:MAG: hypothetical protein AB1736_04000 [Chloroflexota bacterium]